MSLRKGMSRLIRVWLTAFVEPRRALGLLGLPRYFQNWRRYASLAGPGEVLWHESYPCLGDWLPHTPFDPHYFYQGWWAARRLADSMPARHVDVGSSVMAVGVIAAWVPTVFLDYRPVKASLPGLSALAGNLLALPFADGSLPSLSCLHVIEHVGLGRYGDPLDPLGSVKAADELVRVLAPGGRLLISTPVGRQRVQFNAHRVFAPRSVVAMFRPLELRSFAMVDDAGVFHAEASLDQGSRCQYACGMFEFVKNLPAPIQDNCASQVRH